MLQQGHKSNLQAGVEQIELYLERLLLRSWAVTNQIKNFYTCKNIKYGESSSKLEAE